MRSIVKKVKIVCKTFKSLSKLSFVTLEISPWWVHCYKNPKLTHQCRDIIRLLLNVHRYGNKSCVFCYGKVNSIQHVLLECPSIQTQRSLLWLDIISVCPDQLRSSIESLNVYERCSFLLNAFNVRYVNEWKLLYDRVSNFISQLYKEYSKAELAVQNTM